MSLKSLTTLAVTIVAVAAANSALAGGCGGGKSYGGGHFHKVYHKPVVHHVHRPIIVAKPVVVDHCHHPKFCLAYVCPGETLLTICHREYGNPAFWTQVAKFNHIPLNAPLAAGQPIKLPTIYDSGRMVVSDSPAPPAPAFLAQLPGPSPLAGPGPQIGFGPGLPQGGQPGFPQQLPLAQQPQPQQPQPQQPMPQGFPQGFPQGQGQGMLQQQPMPQQQQMQQQPMQQMGPPQQPFGPNVQQVAQASPQMGPAFQRPVPTFTAGSQLVLDGQQFGNVPGQVLLIVGSMRIPAQLANWAHNEVAVLIPQIDLTQMSDAQIVVLNSNGQLVTSSNIRLAPAASRLAMGN